MGFRRRDVLKLVTSSAAAAAMGLQGKRASAAWRAPIVRDVCIIGGGSAGTYTAIRLRDLGKSVAVVERADRLGGHAETFRDPATGTPIDIGVVVFENVDLVKNYFARFNVALNAFPSSMGSSAYVDFRSGRVVNGYAPPPNEQFVPALLRYRQVLSDQFPYLDLGFQLPDPVPSDLLLPFGDFARKHGIEAMLPTMFLYAQGLGNLLENPAIYVLKNFSLQLVNSLLTSPLLRVPGGVAELYDKAAQFLGEDVLFESGVVRVERGPRGVQVYVATPEGLRIIRSKKLVVAFPPSFAGLAPFDLDPLEASHLLRFRPNYYWTGVLRLSGLPPGQSVQNVAPDTPYNIPPLPGVYSISPSPVPELWNVKYGSGRPLSDQRVRANIAADLRRMNAEGTFPVVLGDFATFKGHAPFELMVSSREIAAGFYRRLGALQGRKQTFYNGAAFQTNDSSLIWSFTELLLPQIVS
jgi:hypothetical protein